MAMAAFQSSLRRTHTRTSLSSDRETKADKDSKRVPPRRSRSVSALSRTASRNDDVLTSDFLIKRDNPLFCNSSGSSNNDSPPNDNDEVAASKPKSKAGGDDGDNRRGRCVARNADVRNVSVGRSLSRAAATETAARRGRSVSRGPVSRSHFVNSESEVEQEGNSSVTCRNITDMTDTSAGMKKGCLSRSSSGLLDQLSNARMRASVESSDGSVASLSNLGTTNWEDGVSISSLSEAEERTIKAVSEQMKSFQGDNLGGDTTNGGIYETVRSEVRRAIAEIQSDLETAIRRSNAASIATTSVTDIPPDLVNPGAVELVLDIRREYAKKLEESQERARKLRADLAVEEHRGLELGRILKEILPEPKSSNGQKSRTGRKNSIERRKISKRLTEEAMAYFDECISLSTFDSSDFSSPEDPPVGFTTPVHDRPSNYPSSRLNDKQDGWSAQSHDAAQQSASSSSKDPMLDAVNPSGIKTDQRLKYQFSFAPSPSETIDLQQDILKYVRNFEKDVQKVNMESRILGSSNYDQDDYALRDSAESLMFDQVFFKNRLESGSLLLCGGGIAITSPFASVI